MEGFPANCVRATRPLRLILLALILVAAPLARPEPPPVVSAGSTGIRTWISNDGQSLQGELVDATEQVATIRRVSDRAVFQIPLERLSVADRQLVLGTVHERWRSAGLSTGPFAAKITGNFEKIVSLQGLRYQLFGRADWDSAKRYPLLVWLHGAGSSGSDNEAQMGEITRFFASRDVQRDHPCFVLAPQCPSSDTGWSHDVADNLMRVVVELRDRLPVDETRVYLTGLSMGGFGTFALAAQHPSVFAAAVPLCGGADPQLAPAMAQALKEVPMWIFHGDKDSVVPIALSRTLYAAIQNAGGKQARFTELPGEGHEIAHVYSRPDLIDWLFAQKRDGGAPPEIGRGETSPPTLIPAPTSGGPETEPPPNPAPPAPGFSGAMSGLPGVNEKPPATSPAAPGG